MKHAFAHDRIVHLGGAEAVLKNLIREKITHNAQDDITLFCLYANRSHLDIDGHAIPIVTALPGFISEFIGFRGEKHDIVSEEHDIIFDEKDMQESSTYSASIKSVFNEGNKLIMKLTRMIRGIASSLLSTFFDYRNLIVLAPQLTHILHKKIQEYASNTLTISSFAAVKNIVQPGTTQNIPITLYLHSPMQYIWENFSEYSQKLAGRQRRIFIPLAKKLQKRDAKPRHYDYVLCNSRYTLACARKYYGAKGSKGTNAFSNAHIQYPKIHPSIIQSRPSSTIKEYYIYVGRLVKFVRETDLIITMANEFNIPLLVIGSGPDEEYLKSIAGETVSFIGRVDDIEDKIQLISQSRGLINLTKESCGIATMEALSLGVPVMGYNAGATPEFVNTTNGVLAETKDMEHLGETFRTFHTSTYDRNAIKQSFLSSIMKSG